jgi:flagellar biosynthesis/type III secretory pathway chaperone
VRSTPPVRLERADGTADSPDSPAAMLAELVHCLHAESDALMARDVEGLARAVERKDRALRCLAPELGRAGQSWLRTAVRDARELNDHNARLLAAHMNVTRARLDCLLGAPGAGALYSPDGRAAGAEGRTVQRGVRA